MARVQAGAESLDRFRLDLLGLVLQSLAVEIARVVPPLIGFGQVLGDLRGVELAGEVLVQLTDARRGGDRPLRLAQLEHVEVAQARLLEQARLLVEVGGEALLRIRLLLRDRGPPLRVVDARRVGEVEALGKLHAQQILVVLLGQVEGRARRRVGGRRAARIGVGPFDRIRGIAGLPQVDRGAKVLLGGGCLRAVPVEHDDLRFRRRPALGPLAPPSRRFAVSITSRLRVWVRRSTRRQAPSSDACAQDAFQASSPSRKCACTWRSRPPCFPHFSR